MSTELARLYHSHQISRAQYRHYNSDWNSTLNVEHGLGGSRHASLERAINRSNCTLSAIAKMITTPTQT